MTINVQGSLNRRLNGRLGARSLIVFEGQLVYDGQIIQLPDE